MIRSHSNIQAPSFYQCLMIMLTIAFTVFNVKQLSAQYAADKIHREAVVVDAHAHQLTLGNDKPDNQLNLKMLEEGAVDAVGLYFAYYPLENTSLVEQVRNDMGQLQTQIAMANHPVDVASGSGQVLEIVEKGNIAVVPGVEYFYGVFQKNTGTVDSLYGLGIRSITLMDNEYDRLSLKGHEEHTSAALSDFGKGVIDRMNRLGMLIDISHLDDQMQLAVIDYSDSPVIASHSPVRGVHHTDRNIPDEILKKMAAKNGAIMITFNSGDLAGVKNGRTDIDRLIDHIMHAIQIAGIDHVGIGSDFNGAGLRSPAGLENASGFPGITAALLNRGLSDDNIGKVLGLNYLNLLESVEEFAHE